MGAHTFASQCRAYNSKTALLPIISKRTFKVSGFVIKIRLPRTEISLFSFLHTNLRLQNEPPVVVSASRASYKENCGGSTWSWNRNATSACVASYQSGLRRRCRFFSLLESHGTRSRFFGVMFSKLDPNRWTFFFGARSCSGSDYFAPCSLEMCCTAVCWFGKVFRYLSRKQSQFRKLK